MLPVGSEGYASCRFRELWLTSSIFDLLIEEICTSEIRFLYVTLHSSIYRSFNGCKTPLNSLPSETFLNGRKNVTLRDNLTVLCPILVPQEPENCPEKLFDFTLAWNVQITILGSWILRAMVFHSND